MKKSKKKLLRNIIIGVIIISIIVLLLLSFFYGKNILNSVIGGNICSSDIDCNDNNANTLDQCINPGKIDSYCFYVS